jgi:F0F1-type ATP synthase beta subunit
MATLSIQNFPDQLYEKLLARAEQERRSVAQEVIHLLEQATELREPLSILGLRGLGKEHWKGVDPVSHVEAERDSWD